MSPKKRTTYGQKGVDSSGKDAVREAVLAYIVPTEAGKEATVATTRLSSKNQLTIPVAMCRLMDMRPGDEIELLVINDTVHMQRLPRTPEEWAHRFDKAPITAGWGSDEEIDEYVRKERAWDKEYDWPQSTS